jgi:two-component system sensor kinase FixL
MSASAVLALGAATPAEAVRTLLEGLDCAVVILDGRLRVAALNGGAAEVLECTEAELRGRRAGELLCERGQSATVCGQLETLRQAAPGDAGTCQWVCELAPGQRLAWSARRLRGGGPHDGLIVCNGVVVTLPGAVERSLQQREEEHRIILSNISDAVFITDDAGLFTYVCPNVAVIFGYSFDEVVAQGNIARLLGTGLFDRAALERRGEIQNVERTIVDKQRRQHVLLVNLKRVAIGGGTVLYTCRDVTARKQMEESLKLYEAELAHATRVSTVGELASGLAHELNQPLSAISNFAQACVRKIRSGTGDAESLLPHLDQVVKQTQRAAEIVRRVRGFSRKGRPEQSRVSVEMIVRDALALVELAARRHEIAFRVEIPPNLPRVKVDTTGIQQVLINLLRNAVDALVEDAPNEPCIAVSACSVDEGRAIEITVADNGPGVPPRLAARMFEPFCTTKKDGMGLGLSISRSILEWHGGVLRVEANAPRGARFSFTLPTG